MEDGTIIPIFTKTEYEEIRQYFGINDLDCSSGSYLMYTYAYVREDYKDTFLGKRGKGKTYFSILKEMAKEKMN